MSTKSFKEFIKDLGEETGAADIAPVDTKLDTKVQKHLQKGKRCKTHKVLNCDCLEETWDDTPEQ